MDPSPSAPAPGAEPIQPGIQPGIPAGIKAGIKVVYVTCRGHSGSTLLDLLLSSHPAVVSVGEVKLLKGERIEPCNCGAATPAECPFWRRVDAALERSSGLRLAELDLASSDRATFAAHNRALFAAVAEVSGCRIVVDSSKALDRLAGLLEVPGLAVETIHLTRSPFGVVYSNLKLGRDWRYHARNYTLGMMKTRRLLAGRDALEVRYEALARDPAGVVAPIMRRLGLAFDPGQLAWAGRERHNLGGNPMRFSASSAIRPDRSWRRGLSLRQMLAVAWLTLPTRFAGTGFYERWKPLFDGKGLAPEIERARRRLDKRLAGWRRRLGKRLRAMSKALRRRIGRSR